MIEHKCDICEKNFKQRKSLTNHRRWHNLPQYKNFQTLMREILSKKAIGEKNPNWTNSPNKYVLHERFRKIISKPKLCETCGKKAPYDLSNIDHQYKNDINDWKWLCRSCHTKYDIKIHNKYYTKNRMKYLNELRKHRWTEEYRHEYMVVYNRLFGKISKKELKEFMKQYMKKFYYLRGLK